MSKNHKSRCFSSISFIFYCMKMFCGKAAKLSFIYCAAAVIISKVVVVTQPLVLSHIVDNIGNQDKVLIFKLITLFCVLGFFAALMTSIKNYYILIFRELLSKDLAITLLKKLQTFSHQFFHESNVSKISQINNSGIEALHGFMVAFLSEIIPFLFEFSLILLIVVAKFSVVISIPIFAVMILYISVSLFFSTRERSSLNKLSSAKINLSSQFYEDVINFDTIKITTAEKSRLAEFSNHADGFLNLAKFHGNLFYKKSLIQNIILYAGLFLILIMSATGYLTKQITAGEFVMLNAFFFQITTPLLSLLRSYETFNKSIIDITPLKELLQRKSELVVTEDLINTFNSDNIVRFIDVSFAYNNQPVLQNITFNIPNKNKVSLVGPSGGGKTTIAKLLLRFYDPILGHIVINGRDLKATSFSQLRSRMILVPQEINLLSTTIMKNITLGLDEAQFETCKNSYIFQELLSFVTELENGFDTLVGDRGMKLSGGQKQRIGIARALIRKPQVLILDEYNSALDANTESDINKYVNPRALDASILLIAHRLSSVIDSDEILVIENGSITQRGNHTELIELEGWYKNAWKAFSRNNIHEMSLPA